MARKAKEILLARGYTEAELAGMETLLKDQKFCAAIEAEAQAADEHAALAEERKNLIEQDQKWYQEYAVPEVEKARADAITARKERAAFEAELKARQDYGLKQVASQEGHQPAPVVNPAPVVAPEFDPSKFVDREAYMKTVQNIPYNLTMLQDISDEHRELFGKSIPGGTSKLFQEYDNARAKEHYQGSFRDFWEKKYKVQDKRDAIEADTRKKNEDAIRLEERNKVLSELGNPMTRPLSTSHSPFTNKPTSTTVDSTGKVVTATQPWERSKEQRSTERVSKFTTKALQSVQ